MNIYALISHNDTKDATDFVRDPKTGKVVFVEQDHAPAKDARELFWVECVRTDDTRFARGFNEKLHVRGEPMFTLEGGRAYATFPLVRKQMAKIYALVSADNTILRTVEQEHAPAHVNHCVWQEVVNDSPAHNPELHETHSPRFEWHGMRVHRRFEIRRKA